MDRERGDEENELFLCNTPIQIAVDHAKLTTLGMMDDDSSVVFYRLYNNYIMRIQFVMWSNQRSRET